MKKTKITKNQYFQIVGLLALAETYTQKINDIESSLREITGEEGDWGHCGDAIYDDHLRNADSLLKKLGIKH